MALQEGMHLLLIHERRGGHEHGAVPFEHFVGNGSVGGVTPKRLLELNVFEDLAVPLYGGRHERVSLRVALCKPGLSQFTPTAVAEGPLAAKLRELRGRAHKALARDWRNVVAMVRKRKRAAAR